MSNAIETLRAALSDRSTEGIAEAIRTMGGGHLPEAERMVRAALIEEYGNRNGVNAADAIMDEIGL